MRKSKKLVLLFLGLTIGIITTTATAYAEGDGRKTLFSDDFETQKFDLWKSPVSQNWEINFGSLSGIYGADVEGPTNKDSALTTSISTVGYQDLELSYRFKADSLEDDEINNDALKVQYSVDNGASWNTIYVIRDGEDDHVDGGTLGLYHKFHTLPIAVNNNANFAIRFLPELAGNPDEIWIDEVMVTGVAQDSVVTEQLVSTIQATASDEIMITVLTTDTETIEVPSSLPLEAEESAKVEPIGITDMAHNESLSSSGMPANETLAFLSHETEALKNVIVTETPMLLSPTPPEEGGVTIDWGALNEPISEDEEGTLLAIYSFEASINQNTASSGQLTSTNESSYEECNDTVDNDQDGLTDTYDEGCVLFLQTLKVITIVHGGDATAQEFMMYFMIPGGSQSDWKAGDELGKEFSGPEQGDWQIITQAKDGYSTTYAGDCTASGSVFMDFNLFNTCRITHTYNN